MTIHLRLSEEEEVMINSINEHLHYKPSTLLRVLIREKYQKLHPAYKYTPKQVIEQSKPWEEMGSEAYCISLGGKVERGYCKFTKGAVTEGVPLSEPQDFKKYV